MSEQPERTEPGTPLPSGIGLPPVAAGWFGKLPHKGDFVFAGLNEDVREEMSRWLDGAMTDARDALGPGWKDAFDASPAIRFWIGGEIMSWGTAIGVIVPSRDRVGRRYPLIVMTAGPVEPPTLVTDQGLHEALQVRALALIEGAEDGDEAGPGPRLPDLIWAVNENADASILLGDAAAADYTRSARGRSYWWTDGGAGRPSAMVGCDGLVDGTALAWLMTGQGGGADAPH
ncbi:type VI secretion system-associated protein TagF [Jannaschia aquimarina]|uniref:Type VI secretion system-associated protein TagF n=1 Tax=Jannaschia aquimarina TaxID=935700 RepID=A0A0D1EM80_9RHOB|nr:type VI secretion system-associated protein TagF [Jannaschia aquimarina]KIT16800.1 hypothetical protein jaqu_14510 [Jannaschia aquimarina]SNT23669.1 type VI secretion system protein ImpM [Jannaschia aquimarina]